MNLERVYAVPREFDEQARTWYSSLYDTHFATTKVGWAVGSAQILHTRDGGKTWLNQYSNLAAFRSFSPRRVFAVNAKTGWIIGLASGADARCCYTRDGGKTWIAKTFKVELNPTDVFLIDSKRAWIASDDGLFPVRSGKILSTTDGGITWNDCEPIIEGKPHQIRFIDAQKGWLLRTYPNQNQTRTRSELLFSGDGGINWRGIGHFDRKLSRFYPLGVKRVLVVGENGFIAQTKDGGKSWKRSRTRTRAFINAVGFYDNRRAIAVGDYDTILLSEDGGEGWEKVKRPDSDEHLIAAHFTSTATGVITTSTGVLRFDIH